MVESKPKVVITGISGFLGSQVTAYFLRDGAYAVRGTVRDTKNEKKLAPLRKAFGEDFARIELVEADLLKPESLDQAIAGCQYVVHTASPFPIEKPKDESVLVRPAVEGTLAVMRAAHKHGVRRVVVTSSVAAVMCQKPENSKEVYDESDWSDTAVTGPYEKSKTLAEKAAWDFLHGLPEAERFELVTINPVLIMGPSLVDGDFSSGQIIKKLMDAVYPGMPKITMPVVDVRDCAQAHLQALKVPEARNSRFILSAETLWFKDYAQALKEKYPRNKIKSGELGYCPVKVASWFDPSVKMILPFWGKSLQLNNQHSKNVLGIQYHDGRESILLMAESMVKAGVIVAK